MATAAEGATWAAARVATAACTSGEVCPITSKCALLRTLRCALLRTLCDSSVWLEHAIRARDVLLGPLALTQHNPPAVTRRNIVNVYINRKIVCLGSFRHPEAGALVYARHLGAAEAWRAHAKYEEKLEAPALTAEEALAKAREEGLELKLAPGTKSGYRGVSLDPRAKVAPWEATLYAPGGKGTAWYGGRFATKEEAALALAREVKRNGYDAMKHVKYNKGTWGWGGWKRQAETEGQECTSL